MHVANLVNYRPRLATYTTVKVELLRRPFGTFPLNWLFCKYLQQKQRDILHLSDLYLSSVKLCAYTSCTCIHVSIYSITLWTMHVASHILKYHPWHKCICSCKEPGLRPWIIKYTLQNQLRVVDKCIPRRLRCVLDTMIKRHWWCGSMWEK